MKETLRATALLGAVVLAASAATADEQGAFDGELRDAWLTGRIESMYLLNEHLNPFRIETEVENGVVTLSGTVESEIDRDLAAALAGNIDGVSEVENELRVDAAAAAAKESDRDQGRRDFGTWVDDATTTAAVKTRLIRNENTRGLKIDVDTREDVVTLSGRVASPEEKALAEEIARQAKDVAGIRNNLVVDPS